MRLNKTYAFLSLTAFLLLYGQTLCAETMQIDAVVVEGTRRVENFTVLNILTVKPGAAVATAEIDNDLRAIYKLRRFNDVTAEIETRAGKQTLVYRVVERPLLRTVTFGGYDELSEEKLKTVAAIKTPAIYDPAAIDTSIEAIRKAYAEEGFYSATVEPKLTVDDDNEATLNLMVNEGQKVLVDAIHFSGNTVFTSKELAKMMETRERWWLSWLTDRGAFQDEILKNDIDIITDRYLDRGHVQVKILPPQVKRTEGGKYLEIYIDIEEGPRFEIGELSCKGDLIKSCEELLTHVPFKTGDIFSRSKLRDGVMALNDIYADQGYAYVNVSPLSHIDADNHRIDLTFDFEQGLQVTLGRIRMTGNVKTRDKVIRREMQLVEGEIFNATKLKESRRRIHNLGFFEEVKLATAKGSSEGAMDVDIEVKERPTGTFSLGFGYSSLDGFIGQGSVTQENFLGNAWKLNLAGSFGSKSTTYQIGLLDPHFLDSDLSLGFDLYKTSREWSDFSKRTLGGDIKLGFPLSDKVRAFFIYRYEEKEIYDVDPSASLTIRSQEGFSTLSSIYGSLTRDRTDYRLDPTTGDVAVASVEIAGLGGTQKFAKYEVDYRWFHPMVWKFVFSAHGHLGYIHKISDQTIPIDERYFLGGLSSIRGFDPRRVGPRTRTETSVLDSTGGVVSTGGSYEYQGGTKAGYGNLEITFPLIEEANLKGVLFFDSGNAWDENENYFSDIRNSAGFGVRWFSPLGPLRLEWGRNFAPRDGEPRTDMQFSIGTLF